MERPLLVMHANYGEQGQTLDEMCGLAVKLGFDGVEFRRRLPGGEPTSEYLDRVAYAVERSGLAKVSFGLPGPDLMKPEAGQREREVEEFEAFLEQAAARFDLGVINTNAGPLIDRSPGIDPADRERHGSFLATEVHWEQAAQGFRRIAKTCERLQVRLAFEVHAGYLHDLPGPTRRLVDSIGSPWMGANLDYGNVIYFKEHPTVSEAVERLKDRLYLVHLKNSLWFGDRRQTVALSAGDINNREFLSLLKASGFSGPLCLESPRSGDRRQFAREDIEYVKTILGEIGWE